MKKFTVKKVKRYENYPDNVNYYFICPNCQREVEIPEFLMIDVCNCGTKWKVKVKITAKGVLEDE